jgi:hypothetical protein
MTTESMTVYLLGEFRHSLLLLLLLTILRSMSERDHESVNARVFIYDMRCQDKITGSYNVIVDWKPPAHPPTHPSNIRSFATLKLEHQSTYQ